MSSQQHPFEAQQKAYYLEKAKKLIGRNNFKRVLTPEEQATGEGPKLDRKRDQSES